MKDQSRVILTADKRVAMGVLHKQDCIDKTQHLLTDKNTYRLITRDPTTKHKNLSKYSGLLRNKVD